MRRPIRRKKGEEEEEEETEGKAKSKAQPTSKKEAEGVTGVTNDAGTRAAASEPHAEGAAQLSKAKRNKAKAKAKSKATTTRAAASDRRSTTTQKLRPLQLFLKSRPCGTSVADQATTQKLRPLQLFLKSRPCGTSVADRRAMWKSMSSEEKSKCTDDARAERGF